MKRITAALLITLSLSGCSTFQQMTSAIMPTRDSNPPKALKEFKPTATVRTLWQANTGSGAGKQYVRIHPYVDNSGVFVAGGKSASAWDKASGKRLWQASLTEDITAGVNGGEGAVFVGGGNGSAIALDRQTGKTLWKTSLGSEVLAVSPAKNGIVVFRTSGGGLYGLSTSSGEGLWKQMRQSPILSLRGASVPLVVGGMVIAGFDSGVVTAFDMRNGAGLWEIPLSIPRGSSDLDRMTDVDGKMKALGEALFATSYNGQIAGINMRNGTAAWAAPYSSHTGVDADPNGLYTSSEEGYLWKLDPQTGNPQWKMDDLEGRQPTAPTLVGHYITVGDKDGYLHWVNASNGQLAARVRGDTAGYTTEPEADGNVIYTLGKSGQLSALTIQ
ncbi:outer membrane protein assembly factor BamB [Thiothrix nivea]|uniref:Outer membrane protein assembly factor BamB n=1 Tax=Thiothrix nivea (strain ATCC 35100 / DSM 5205 / JP2) TaxID=870187 RepID=A0A656HAW1_THINJ|nr:outer membrane protein assembly factor BamB [Thiothrix nivea]EIJ33467.1 outer membrane assembly lipoprotein YfgL [Thiothrix nivea DSM 5205]